MTSRQGLVAICVAILLLATCFARAETARAAPPAAAIPGAVLLTRDGDGHTAFIVGNRCIDDAVSTYLLDGSPPPAGTVC